jgi:murein DD-endopeptidase MepM/ murein hydrolase activator NlpD
MRKFFLFLFLFFFSSALFSLEVNIIEKHPANGKSTLLLFNKEKGTILQDVRYGRKRFPIFSDPDNAQYSYALIPFSYYTKLGKKVLYIDYIQHKKHKRESLFIEVVSGGYKKEEIHVSASKVNPRSKQVQKRISKEYSEAMRIYHTITLKSYIHKPFILPLHSKITSNFGKARIYNGSLKGYHSGTDFRAKVGTPIIAANDGRVVLVKKRFYSGGTVIVDHGEGIYTCYFHMSHFDVQKGTIVHRGQKLGLSGQSGRVTGPHLHFAARVDGVQVDPLQLIKLLNNNLLKEKN